jgi:hypothetical protein
MGFLSGAGQGFAKGVNDMFSNYNEGSELSMARAEQARQAQIQAIQIQQAQQALQQEAAYKQELGLLGDKPTVDQLFAIQRKYDPKNAINNQLNYTKSEEANKIKEEANKIKMEQFEQRMKQQIEMLNMKNDVASQLQAQKLQNVLDAIRLKASTPNVNVHIGDKTKAPSLKFQTDYAKASSKKDELIAQMDDIDAHADRLLKTNLGRITGVVGALPNIPGSQGADAQAALDSFRSKLGLTTLASLKSGTGAGLGQVTEAEHKLLQNYVSELDNAQSEQAIRDSVRRIQEWSRKAKGRMSSGYERSPFGQFDRQQNGESEPVSNSKPRFTIKSVK